ncbi:alpha/beta hydrolase [Branchiibius sp. NY16-3462-2]|uniref:alpha/beta hydrolase n=1 Tax=Branchiibius sp. NY16-3462-2 TaxID=1807500 RepID=UPI000792D015|nr:alpha/beta hydrolase [Branchiibius sp. NY16-3462-2]KYH46285.1 hypothetical protein AZH51_11790 [Branchiibius sp. NY16-3462-2]
MTTAYRTHDVAVRGGHLRVAEWAPEQPPVATVLAVHGITASHLAWTWLADALPQVRILAPDLRGRGRSNALPGPFGLAAHAADLVDVLEAFDLPSAVVVGHSMGGFVAATLAHQRPDLVAGLLLVDGGLPLPLPDGVGQDEAGEAAARLLGPAAERLTRSFPDHSAYREFWAAHPAFVGEWSERLERYIDYDLDGDRPATLPQAMLTDAAQLYGGPDYRAVLQALPEGTVFLSAPRGLLDEEPGLYPESTVAQWSSRFRGLSVRGVGGVNHYTIVMSDQGVAAVCESLGDLLRLPVGHR